MRWQNALYIYALLAILVAATLQSGEMFVVFGVKPNLVLVLLAVFVFFTPRFFPYALLAVFACTVLRFAPGLNWDVTAFLMVSLFFYYIRDRFFSSGLFGVLVFVFFGTILFYLLLSPSFMYHEGVVVAKELIYNLLLALGLFSLTTYIYEKKGRSPIR